jgi:hypothetical protein
MQFEEGGRLSYLGMDISIADEGTIVDMSFYVKQLVADAENRKTLVLYDSPGTKESFVYKEDEKKLENAQRVYYHSTVAKLLYLAKRARPDILTVVIFLCTRVQEATVEDEKKIGRVLGYLKKTESRTLILRATDPNC